jgi:hypothetical protein
LWNMSKSYKMTKRRGPFIDQKLLNCSTSSDSHGECDPMHDEHASHSQVCIDFVAVQQ